MYMFKCKECNLITSEEFMICPKCSLKADKIKINTDDEDKVIFKLTLEDIYYILENRYDEDVLKYIDNKNIVNFMRDNIEIEWDEYIEGFIDNRTLPFLKSIQISS